MTQKKQQEKMARLQELQEYEKMARWQALEKYEKHKDDIEERRLVSEETR
jgi:hypothetical protein